MGIFDWFKRKKEDRAQNHETDMSAIAEQAVQTFADAEDRALLDYSERSLVYVEDILRDMTGGPNKVSGNQMQSTVELWGAYILEVGRRNIGGRYQWHDQLKQPVLVYEKGDARVAMVTWDKVRGRLRGDAADNIPFFYQGFAECARAAESGTDALYV